jgi:hypothetical protein
LKEQEKGLTARPLKLTVHLNQAGAKTRWLKNGNPMTVYTEQIFFFSICVLLYLSCIALFYRKRLLQQNGDR